MNQYTNGYHDALRHKKEWDFVKLIRSPKPEQHWAYIHELGRSAGSGSNPWWFFRHQSVAQSPFALRFLPVEQLNRVHLRGNRTSHAFIIDWDEVRDENTLDALVAKFRVWVKANRPKQFPRKHPGRVSNKLWQLACYRLKTDFGVGAKEAADLLGQAGYVQKMSAQVYSRAVKAASIEINQRRLELGIVSSHRTPV